MIRTGLNYLAPIEKYDKINIKKGVIKRVTAHHLYFPRSAYVALGENYRRFREKPYFILPLDDQFHVHLHRTQDPPPVPDPEYVHKVLWIDQMAREMAYDERRRWLARHSKDKRYKAPDPKRLHREYVFILLDAAGIQESFLMLLF